MFSTSGIFRDIPCPAGPANCKLVNCIFSHEPKAETPVPSQPKVVEVASPADDELRSRKRRKLDDERQQLNEAIRNLETTSLKAPIKEKPVEKEKLAKAGKDVAERALPSALRPISPPLKTVPVKSATNITNGKAAAKKPPDVQEKLAPRPVAKLATPWAKRMQFLKLIHGEVVRLNTGVKDLSDAKTKSLVQSDNEVIRLVLDVEEDAAKTKPLVYENVMKLAYKRFKDLTVKGWVDERNKLAKTADAPNTTGVNGSPHVQPDGPIEVKTGLSPEEEITMLERFILSPQQMSQAGFILAAPMEKQMEEARKVIEASGSYETCDRCGSRFQILKKADENGRRTTGGHCVHHWGRVMKPKREKTDAITGPKEARYTCCNRPQGSDGCTTVASHVYKVSGSNVGRLATTLQFETTPMNTKVERMAVAFDCEMGYTTEGMEVIRLSAVKWPSNEPLIDVLVKPFGYILDLNTKWSGVTSQHFMTAVKLDTGKEAPLPSTGTAQSDPNTLATVTMKVVESPAAARDLLTSFISPATVLIGHAIDNDVNVLRLLHPTIVDTSLLFSHPGGLPYRFALRKLAKDFLNLDIQTAGAAGHDSMEDSRATGDLVRWKIAKEWEKYKNTGWTVKDGKFYATIGGEAREATLPKYSDGQGWVNRKRKAEQDGEIDGVGQTVALSALVKERATAKESA